MMLYAMKNHTSQNGERTAGHVRHSTLTIHGKDPNFDYSFRTRKAVEDGGGEDIYGWRPIGEGNNSGENFSLFPGQKRTSGSKAMNYLDTVACRRPKETSKYFREEEDDKYNSQIMHVRNASKRARDAFRSMDSDSVVKEKVEFKGPGMTQRSGPTEGGKSKKESIIHEEGN